MLYSTLQINSSVNSSPLLKGFGLSSLYMPLRIACMFTSFLYCNTVWHIHSLKKLHWPAHREGTNAIDRGIY